MTTALSVLEYSPGRSKVPYGLKSAIFVDVWASRAKTEEGDKPGDGDAGGEDASTGDEKKDYAALLSQPDCHCPTCFLFMSMFRPALPGGVANGASVCFIFHRG